MDPTDKELREQMSQGPLIRNGFDERLRRRIEDSLDAPRSRFGRRVRFGRTFVGAAAAVVLAIAAFGVWQWGPLGAGDDGKSKLATPQASALATSIEQDDVISSALLLGLRKDVSAPDGGTVSTYRTVLVAPENNKLQIAAEGSGIVMPYKTTFWKIESTPDDGETESQTLIAYQAYGSKALTERPASVVATPRPGLLSERLLYVGKEYVSVAEEAMPAAGEDRREYRYVKDIKQLAASAGTAFSPKNEAHVRFADVSGTDASTGASGADASAGVSNADQWSIARLPGQWTAVAYGDAGDAGAIDPNSARTLADKLAEDVAPNDSLQLSWDQIRSIDPNATDAFSYDDLLATVDDREINVYPYKMKDGLSQPLTLELEPDETIIMVQWALNQSETKNYADQWKLKVAQILGQP